MTFMVKWRDPASFIASLQDLVPFPQLSGWLAIATEGIAVPLFLLGLATRIWCLPTMFLLVVAIAEFHWSHGFSGEGGYQLQLMLLLILFSLFVTGPGKVSLDALLARKHRKKSS
jgi:putative oxidoreductase